MSDRTLKIVAAFAALGVVADAVWLAQTEWGSIAAAVEKGALQTGTIMALVGVLLIFEVGAAVVALSGRAGMAVRASKGIWIGALVVLAGCCFLPQIDSLFVTGLFSTFATGWYGQTNFRIADTFNLPSLIPLLLLIQWVAGSRLVDSGRPARELWAGAAIGAISFCAVLGLFVVLPPLSPKREMFGTGPTMFFVVGTGLHVAAIWALARRSWYDTLWAAVIGAGCLISGFVLTNGRAGLMTPNRTESDDIGMIGSILYVGWYEFAPYMAIVAYAVTAIAAVALWKLPRQGVAPDAPKA